MGTAASDWWPEMVDDFKIPMNPKPRTADRHVMKKSIALFGTLFWLFAGTAAAQDASQLVGRWRSVETSKGGLGAMYDFLANGTVQFSPGAIVQEPYHIEGDRLTIGAAEPVQFAVAFNGDDRVRLSAKGGGENYTRLGARGNGQNRLVGEWTGTRDMDGVNTLVHWIFGADGNSTLMIRFKTDSGTYTVQSGRLFATFGGRVGLDGTITLSGDTLAIARSGGRVTRLARY